MLINNSVIERHENASIQFQVLQNPLDWLKQGVPNKRYAGSATVWIDPTRQQVLFTGHISGEGDCNEGTAWFQNGKFLGLGSLPF